MPNRRSNLWFGSFLVYPPRPQTKTGAAYKAAVLGIKHNEMQDQNVRWPDYAADRLRAYLPGSLLERYFDDQPTLVPVPTSGVLPKENYWPTRRICEALISVGIGGSIENLVARETAVPRSAGAKKRPTLQEQYDSLKPVVPSLTRKIILVDDIITRGATALACAWRIQEAMPRAKIKVFTMGHTMTGDPQGDIVDIILGMVTWNGGNSLTRDPWRVGK